MIGPPRNEVARARGDESGREKFSTPIVPRSPDEIRAALATLPAESCALAECMGAAIKGELGDAGFDVWFAWNRDAGFDDEQDLRNLWEKLKGGETLELLFNEARQRGFDGATAPAAAAAAAPPRSPIAPPTNAPQYAETDSTDMVPRESSAAKPTPPDNVVHLLGPLPAPPYEATTRSRGMWLRIDTERLFRSDSFAKIPDSLRPAWAFLFLIAWEYGTPTGSLPCDDELLAARLGLERQVFATQRDLLLRGWYRASDDRLYHPVLTEFVLDMIGFRSREATRKQQYRASKRLDSLSHGTDAGQTRDAGQAESPVPRDLGQATATATAKENTSPSQERKGSVLEERRAGP